MTKNHFSVFTLKVLISACPFSLAPLDNNLENPEVKLRTRHSIYSLPHRKHFTAEKHGITRYLPDGAWIHSTLENGDETDC